MRQRRRRRAMPTWPWWTLVDLYDIGPFVDGDGRACPGASDSRSLLRMSGDLPGLSGVPTAIKDLPRPAPTMVESEYPESPTNRCIQCKIECWRGFPVGPYPGAGVSTPVQGSAKRREQLL